MIDLITKIVPALAWPITTLIIFYSLRSEVAALLKGIRRLKHGETELEFNERLQEIVDVAGGDSKLLMPPASKGGETQVLISNLLQVDPLSAILAAWVKFSNAAQLVLEVEEGKSPSPLRLINSLLKHHLINDHDAEVLHMIRNLRNDAAHGRTNDVDLETACKVCRVLIVISDELESKRKTGYETSLLTSDTLPVRPVMTATSSTHSRSIAPAQA